MKIKLTVDLLRDNSTTILGAGQSIMKIADTHSAAKALVQAEIDARLSATGQQLQELTDANSAFNS